MVMVSGEGVTRAGMELVRNGHGEIGRANP